MNMTYPVTKTLFIISFCLTALGASLADAEEKIFNFSDQYIELEANMFPGESKSVFGLEVTLKPKQGWKVLAGNSSSVKPLRLKISPSKCLKLKDTAKHSAPDLAGTDDSGSYSEYFTKTASIRQEFSRIKCSQKSGLDGIATLTYLLCQDNKCVGPFSKDIRFKGLEQK